MFYLIDKPIGMSSFDVIRTLRKITGIKKMGHTGTLDPLASGCLIIATDNSTKLISKLEHHTKRYIFTVDIGIRSDSLDLGTPTQAVDTSGMTIPSFHTLEKFILQQTSQVPPKYSALHIGGRRAYELSRAGVDFSIQERPIEILSAEVQSSEGSQITIDVTVSAGTYIRSLAPILAEYCGVPHGGCIASLRRVGIGDISVEDAQSLKCFDKDTLISYRELFPQIDTIDIPTELIRDIQNGKTIPIEGSMSQEKEYFLRCGYILSLAIPSQSGWKIVRNNI